MSFIDITLSGLLTWIFIAFLSLLLLLNIIGIPANWLIIGLLALWDWLSPIANHPGWLFWLLIASLGTGGEILENMLQMMQGKHAGASRQGMWAGFIGGFVGSILFAPVFFGLGALAGALGGAWVSCLAIEILHGKPVPLANRAAIGTLMGKLSGVIAKLGVGAAIIYIAMHAFTTPRGI